MDGSDRNHKEENTFPASQVRRAPTGGITQLLFRHLHLKDFRGGLNAGRLPVTMETAEKLENSVR